MFPVRPGRLGRKARKAAGRIVAMVPVGILRKNVPAG